MLIATRALLGVAGATLLPSTVALIRNLFVDPRQRAVAIGIWAAVFSAGTALGPVLGGALLESFWWGSVFLLGLPLMAGLLALGPALLPEFRDPDAGRLDLRSAGLSLAGVLGVVYGLKRIAEDGLAAPPVLFIGAGVIVGVAFVLRQRTLPDPLIDLRLFRIPAFSVSLAAGLLALFTWAGTYLFLAQYLQLVEGLSPLEAGMWLLPAAVGSIAGSMLSPALTRRVRPATVLAAGLWVAAGGFAVVTQVETTSSLALLVTGSIVFSIGIASTVALVTDQVVGAAPPERAGAAAAVSETGGELGLALGVAIMGSIGTAVYRGDLDDALAPGLPAEAQEAARDTLGGAVAAAATAPRIRSRRLPRHRPRGLHPRPTGHRSCQRARRRHHRDPGHRRPPESRRRTIPRPTRSPARRHGDATRDRPPGDSPPRGHAALPLPRARADHDRRGRDQDRRPDMSDTPESQATRRSPEPTSLPAAAHDHRRVRRRRHRRSQRGLSGYRAQGGSADSAGRRRSQAGRGPNRGPVRTRPATRRLLRTGT